MSRHSVYSIPPAMSQRIILILCLAVVVSAESFIDAVSNTAKLENEQIVSNNTIENKQQIKLIQQDTKLLQQDIKVLIQDVHNISGMKLQF